MPGLGRQRPRARRAAAPSPPRSRRKNAPSRPHGGLLCPPTPNAGSESAERGRPPAAALRLRPALRRGAAGAASPRCPLRRGSSSSPGLQFWEAAARTGGGSRAAVHTRTRPHPGRSFPLCRRRWEPLAPAPAPAPVPVPVPVPPQGWGRLSLAPSSASLRASGLSPPAPGRGEADRHLPGKRDPLAPPARHLTCGRAGGGMGRPAAVAARSR